MRSNPSILSLLMIWACSSESPGTDTTPPDTIAPTVTVTEPGPVTLTGEVPVSADAEDDRGVFGVRFRVDEADAVPEDTTAPYEGIWNSRSVPNGVHFIDAVARDGAGNTVASSPVRVKVNNGPN
jgi:bacterial leucyl aminopeptidase